METPHGRRWGWGLAVFSEFSATGTAAGLQYSKVEVALFVDLSIQNKDSGLN